MPQTKFAVNAIGVSTICLVAILVLFGLLCIVYSFNFRNRVRSQGFFQLGYFSGPWIIKIVFTLLTICWGLGEIARLNFLRHEGQVLNSLNLKWQEIICKSYIILNLGFAEPCFFLTLVFLLRSSVQVTTLNQKSNCKATGYIFLLCLPLFILHLIVVLIGPKFSYADSQILPLYFTSTTNLHKSMKNTQTAFCTYPLMGTIFLGLFATILTIYMFWLGRKILGLVINKGLQKRVYTLVLSVSCFLPLRVVFLGLSVLSKPEDNLFETLVFLAFLSFLCCAGLGVCSLVYFPVADSLVLRNLQYDVEARWRMSEEYKENISLIHMNSSGLISFRASHVGEPSDTIRSLEEIK